MRFSFVFLLAATSLAAQSVSAGFKLGAPLTEPYTYLPNFSTFTQGRWTGGPTVELHLPYRFSLELDALYRNSHSSFSYPFSLGPNSNAYVTSSTQKTNAWDFPLLLKYRFRVAMLHPFISGGYQWTRQSNDGISSYTCTGPQGSCKPADYPFPTPSGGRFQNVFVRHGPAAGAGLDFKTRYVTISPELRFTRPTNSGRNDNNFTALVGFTFGNKR